MSSSHALVRYSPTTNTCSVHTFTRLPVQGGKWWTVQDHQHCGLYQGSVYVWTVAALEGTLLLFKLTSLYKEVQNPSFSSQTDWTEELFSLKTEQALPRNIVFSTVRYTLITVYQSREETPVLFEKLISRRGYYFQDQTWRRLTLLDFSKQWLMRVALWDKSHGEPRLTLTLPALNQVWASSGLYLKGKNLFVNTSFIAVGKFRTFSPVSVNSWLLHGPVLPLTGECGTCLPALQWLHESYQDMFI